ncbi:MAG: phosphotransferase, partial [Candidatus Wallbacteria bacterium]|nr:phosphotransferase [Candidatus Wallbacteria bacterium]
DGIDGARALIHADLHFGNVVFSANRAAPIDFDDAGFGYLMYDVATSLIPYVESPRWPELRDSLLTGYADVRPLPEQQLAVLPEFLAARNLTMAVWLTLRQPLIHRLPRDLGPFLARTAGLCRQIAD